MRVHDSPDTLYPVFAHVDIHIRMILLVLERLIPNGAGAISRIHRSEAPGCAAVAPAKDSRSMRLLPCFYEEEYQWRLTGPTG